MIWIYGMVFFMILLFYIGTLRYRKRDRLKLDKKKHKLIFSYGMAMFLADGPLKRILLKNSRMIDTKLKSLYVKEQVETEKYFFIVSKISFSIVVIFVTCILGLFSEISREESNNKIVSLERNEYGGGDNICGLEAEAGGEYENFNVVVPEREYTEEEAIQRMEESREELIGEVLGENKSQEKITKPLNFVDTVGEEEIQVIWEVEDDKIINWDGTLGKHISEDGEMTKIYAILTIGNVSVQHEINLNVFPAEENGNTQEMIQNIIDDYDSSEKEIPLPSKVGDEEVSFYKTVDNTAVYFLPVGIIIAVFVFIIKDKDIDKEVKRRNEQLLIDYPEIISKIMLLNIAGISMRRAWEKAVESCGNKADHYVYQEMKLSIAKIGRGVTESKAYEQFGKRCGMHCYVRFSNIINQNLKRGSSELGKVLNIELQNALQERKNNALKIGEEAGTKLLGPMVMMLIIGMVIIVAPAFMSIKF